MIPAKISIFPELFRGSKPGSTGDLCQVVPRHVRIAYISSHVHPNINANACLMPRGGRKEAAGRQVGRGSKIRELEYIPPIT